MKALKLLSICAFAFFALTACNDDEEEIDLEAEAAAAAAISSDSSYFTATNAGGTIVFSAKGGEAVINVKCDTDWTVKNSGDNFDVTVNTNVSTVTVTAAQNTVEESYSGTVVFETAEKGIQFATVTVTQDAYLGPELSIGTTEWNAPAVGNLTKEIAVSCALDDYEVVVSEDWLTYEKTETGITLTAEENTEYDGREASVTITANDGIKSETGTIEVTQDAKVYLTISENSFQLYTDAATVSLSVQSNYEWTCSYDAEWLEIQSSQDTLLTAFVAENANAEGRSVTVTVSAGDGAENEAEARFIVSQYGLETMILTFEISSENGYEVYLPLAGEVDCTVDWGENEYSTQRITEANPSHTFSNDGTYDVCITGTVTALSYDGIYVSSGRTGPTYNRALIEVKQWGLTGLTSMYRAFQCCVNLVTLPEHSGNSFADVETFEYAFYYAYSLVIPAGLLENCQKVTTFLHCFDNCNTNLKEIPEGLFDDCPLVEDFSYLFYNCGEITTIPTNLFSNCLKVNDFSYTFYVNRKLTGESPYNEIVVDGETVKVHLYERELYLEELGCVNPETHKYCFRDCTSLSDYSKMPTSWTTSSN